MVGVAWTCVSLEGEPQSDQINELIDLGLFYHKNGDGKEAVKYFKKALKISETSPVYNNLGVVYMQTDDLGKACNAFDRALKLDSSCPQALCNLGLVMYKAGRFDKTIEFLNYIIKWPEVSKEMLIHAHNDTGCAHFRKGDYEAAKNSFETAIVLDSNFDRPYANMGNSYCEQRDFDSAANRYNKAIALNENCSSAFNGLGVIELNNGNFDKAKEYFDNALSKNNFCVAARVNQNILKKISAN